MNLKDIGVRFYDEDLVEGEQGENQEGEEKGKEEMEKTVEEEGKKPEEKCLKMENTCMVLECMLDKWRMLSE